MPRASDDPYRPVPIYVPVEVIRVVRKIAGYHAVCRGCGQGYRSASVRARFCCNACRQSVYRLRKRQRERLLEEAEEERIAQAEEALRRRRRLPRDLLGRALPPAAGAVPGSAPGAPKSASVTARGWRRGEQ